jgi:2'-5' RNA ligase
VFPPADVQGAAYGVSEVLRRPGDGVSWVKPENLHYTLRFIGDVGADGLRRVSEAAASAGAAHAPFDAELGGVGAFPSPKRARVIWLGMTSGAEALIALAKDLEAELHRLGFERAEHPFSAHLTLGRVRNPGRDWSETLAAAHVSNPPRFRVDRVLVVESQLSPKGSTYTVRAEGPLKGAG